MVFYIITNTVTSDEILSYQNLINSYFLTEYFSDPELPKKVEAQVAELNSRLKRANRQ